MSVPSDVGSVLQFLDNKCILVTGATGFLAKIFVEKIMRVQPNFKKMYLLLRASDSKSAMHRFNNEVLGKDLFRLVKEKYGSNLSSMISEKIRVVAGDISCEDLGIENTNVTEEMLNELDVIVNLAATTKFDDRYDVSLGINTMGAVHVLNFAKKCTKLKVLLHVSTAYVCGEKTGIIPETPYRMGETLNGEAFGLDIETEKKLVEERLKELRADGASPEAITREMTDLGLKRAKMHGWPNTYVFTKTMGEMLVGQMKHNIPLVILRPTIITSTYKEPFPGWTEGIRTIDSMVVGYGKGKLTCFLGDLHGIMDVLPADMVVNSMIVSMAAHAGKENQEGVIYQVGSSYRNPMVNRKLKECGYNYFTKKPWVNKDGQEVVVGNIKVLDSMSSFHTYMTVHYLIPLKALELANMALCNSLKKTYNEQKRRIDYATRLAQLYRPYLFFNGIFEDTNTEKLRVAAKQSGTETEVFYFDPKCINWEDYFTNVHLPGLVKYVFK